MVLYVLAGQVAAKIFEVKVGSQKLTNRPDLTPMCFGLGWTGRFFLDFQLWPQIFLEPLNLQELKDPHLEDLIHICLETEVQAWLLMCVMLALSTPISYHTGGLVKTEVMSTVQITIWRKESFHFFSKIKLIAVFDSLWRFTNVIPIRAGKSYKNW